MATKKLAGVELSMVLNLEGTEEIQKKLEKLKLTTEQIKENNTIRYTGKVDEKSFLEIRKFTESLTKEDLNKINITTDTTALTKSLSKITKLAGDQAQTIEHMFTNALKGVGDQKSLKFAKDLLDITSKLADAKRSLKTSSTQASELLPQEFKAAAKKYYAKPKDPVAQQKFAATYNALSEDLELSIQENLDKFNKKFGTFKVKIDGVEAKKTFADLEEAAYDVMDALAEMDAKSGKTTNTDAVNKQKNNLLNDVDKLRDLMFQYDGVKKEIEQYRQSLNSTSQEFVAESVKGIKETASAELKAVQNIFRELREELAKVDEARRTVAQGKGDINAHLKETDVYQGDILGSSMQFLGSVGQRTGFTVSEQDEDRLYDALQNNTHVSAMEKWLEKLYNQMVKQSADSLDKQPEQNTKDETKTTASEGATQVGTQLEQISEKADEVAKDVHIGEAIKEDVDAGVKAAEASLEDLRKEIQSTIDALVANADVWRKYADVPAKDLSGNEEYRDKIGKPLRDLYGLTEQYSGTKFPKGKKIEFRQSVIDGTVDQYLENFWRFLQPKELPKPKKTGGKQPKQPKTPTPPQEPIPVELVPDVEGLNQAIKEKISVIEPIPVKLDPDIEGLNKQIQAAELQPKTVDVTIKYKDGTPSSDTTDNKIAEEAQPAAKSTKKKGSKKKKASSDTVPAQLSLDLDGSNQNLQAEAEKLKPVTVDATLKPKEDNKLKQVNAQDPTGKIKETVDAIQKLTAQLNAEIDKQVVSINELKAKISSVEDAWNGLNLKEKKLDDLITGNPQELVTSLQTALSELKPLSVPLKPQTQEFRRAMAQIKPRDLSVSLKPNIAGLNAKLKTAHINQVPIVLKPNIAELKAQLAQRQDIVLPVTLKTTVGDIKNKFLSNDGKGSKVSIPVRLDPLIGAFRETLAEKNRKPFEVKVNLIPSVTQLKSELAAIKDFNIVVTDKRRKTAKQTQTSAQSSTPPPKDKVPNNINQDLDDTIPTATVQLGDYTDASNQAAAAIEMRNAKIKEVTEATEEEGQTAEVTASLIQQARYDDKIAEIKQKIADSDLLDRKINLIDQDSIEDTISFEAQIDKLIARAQELSDRLKKPFADKNEKDEVRVALDRRLKILQQIIAAENQLNTGKKQNIGHGVGLFGGDKSATDVISDLLHKKGYQDVKLGRFNPDTQSVAATVIDANNVMKQGVITVKQYTNANNKAADSIDFVVASEREYMSTGRQLVGGIKQKIHNLMQYVTGLEVIMRAVNEIRQGFAFVMELDSKLTTINQTMDVTQAELHNLSEGALSLGKGLKSSAQDVLDAVAIYANATETTESILEKAKPTIMLANASGVDAATASDQIQGVWIKPLHTVMCV